MNIKFKSLIVGLLSSIGLISCITVAIFVVIFFIYKQENTVGISTPLEKNWGTDRYFSDVNQRPLKKSEVVQVVRVKVLKEEPSSALLEVLYDSKDDSMLDDVWISASILRDSGWPATGYQRPAKAFPGLGSKAVIEVGISDSAKEGVVASNIILIQFYRPKQSPFHEARYEYERIWCKKPSAIKDLLRQPYPEEVNSPFSLQGARTISRLCLRDID